MKRVINQQKTDDKLITGTYVHCDLVPSIAGWIDPEFQIKCSRIINGLINREFCEKIAQQAEVIRVEQGAHMVTLQKLEKVDGELQHVELALNAEERAHAETQVALMQADTTIQSAEEVIEPFRRCDYAERGRAAAD